MDWTAIMSVLADRARAEPARSFPADPARGALCGVYGWWADEPARRLIATALAAEIPALIYVGKAGGTNSGQTFASRVRGKHLRGSVRTSTLRQSLTAILLTDPAFAIHQRNPREPATKRAVSEWMAEHLHVAIVPIEGVHEIESAERAAIALYDPPLNLSHVAPSPARTRLRELRLALRLQMQVARIDASGLT